MSPVSKAACRFASRSYFEPRFGHDLSQLLIVFGSGEYAHATLDGRRLLAHELTHVVQQRATSTDRASGRPLAGGSAAAALKKSKGK
jgi:hypothetical protein